LRPNSAEMLFVGLWVGLGLVSLLFCLNLIDKNRNPCLQEQNVMIELRF